MSLGVVKFIITIIFVFVVLKFILPARGVRQITVNELRNQLEDDTIQFIDVRQVSKYNQFHIFGFKNIPVSEISKQVNTLSKEKEIVTICQTGAQGNRACKKLKRQGFTKLSNVRGGISTWEPIHIDRT